MLKTVFVVAIAATSFAAVPAMAAHYYDYSGGHVGDLAGGKSEMRGTSQRPGAGYDYSGSWVGDLAGGKSALHGTTYYVQPDGSLSTRRPGR